MADYNIVIIGGNFAGLGAAHYILKHVLPALPSKTHTKVTVISPSSHFFHKISSPRSAVRPDLQAPEKTFISIAEGFKQYPSEKFEFVQGEAVALDPRSKTVQVKLTDGSETTSVTYNKLVVATGTTSASPLWTLQGSHEHSLNAIRELSGQVEKAQRILVAGGGAAGVETAGEIMAKYGKTKDVTILSGDERLLPRLRNHAVGDAAEKQLTKGGVTVKHNLRVTASEKTASGTTSLKLDDGSQLEVELYIDATGGKPNTSFLPREWLNEQGKVVTDSKTLRSTQAGEDVYCMGDAASYSNGSIFDSNWSVPAFGSSIKIDILKALDGGSGAKQKVKPLPQRGWLSWLFGTNADERLQQKEYSQQKKDFIVSALLWLFP